MTVKPMTTGRKYATVGVLAVFGAAITAATWLGGEHGLALGLAVFYLVGVGVTYLWSRGSGDFAAIIRLSGDERQRQIDNQATAIAGLVTIGFCLVGAIVDLARGGSGSPWTVICGVAGIAYVLAAGLVRHRL